MVDVDHSPQEVLFYNLNGNSFANSFQAEFSIDLMTHLTLKRLINFMMYKVSLQEVKCKERFKPNIEFFGNLAYETHIKDKGQQWKFDVTYNWLGEQRLPYTQSNPAQYRLDEYARAFGTLNAQITRTFSSTFEVYVGGENMGNYKQMNGIVQNENPFGTYFDSSMIYGPTFGAMYYAGLRFKIRDKKESHKIEELTPAEEETHNH